jgi:hypothetical protein
VVVALVAKSTERRVVEGVVVESQLKERDAQRETSTEEVVLEGIELLF